MTDPLRLIGLAAAAAGVVLCTLWVESWTDAPPPEATPADTVRVTRTLTETDTITRTRAETVVRYDTVRQTDSIYVDVPSGWRPYGMIGQQPVDITGDEVTLSYFRRGRWEQKVYTVEPDTWAFQARSTMLAASSWAAIGATVGPSYKADFGPIGLKVSAGLGYGVHLAQTYEAGPVIATHLTLTTR